MLCFADSPAESAEGCAFDIEKEDQDELSKGNSGRGVEQQVNAADYDSTNDDDKKQHAGKVSPQAPKEEESKKEAQEFDMFADDGDLDMFAAVSRRMCCLFRSRVWVTDLSPFCGNGSQMRCTWISWRAWTIKKATTVSISQNVYSCTPMMSNMRTFIPHFQALHWVKFLTSASKSRHQ